MAKKVRLRNLARLAVATLLVVAAASGCKPTEYGVLSGTVVDLDEDAISGVTVRLLPSGIEDGRTDPNGNFSIRVAIDTKYEVVVEKTGYKKQQDSLPIFAPGARLIRNFTLGGDTCEPGAKECGEDAILTCNSTGTGTEAEPCMENSTCVGVATGPECRREANTAEVCLDDLAANSVLRFPIGVTQASFQVKNCGAVDLGELTVQSSASYVTVIDGTIPNLPEGVAQRIRVTYDPVDAAAADCAVETLSGVTIRVESPTDSGIGQVAQVEILRDLGCDGQCPGAANNLAANQANPGSCVCSANQCRGCCSGTECISLSTQTDQRCGEPMTTCADCGAGNACNTQDGVCECAVTWTPEQATLMRDATCGQQDPNTQCIITEVNSCDNSTRTQCVSCSCNAATCTGCCDAADSCIAPPTDSECPSSGPGSRCETCIGTDAICYDDPGTTVTDFQCCAPNCTTACPGAPDGCGGTCSASNAGCACCDGATCLASGDARCQPYVVGGFSGTTNPGLSNSGFQHQVLCDPTGNTCVQAGFETRPQP